MRLNIGFSPRSLGFTVNLTEVFWWFSSVLQENTGEVTYNRPRSLSSASFPVPYLPFDEISTELLRTPVNRLQINKPYRPVPIPLKQSLNKNEHCSLRTLNHYTVQSKFHPLHIIIVVTTSSFPRIYLNIIILSLKLSCYSERLWVGPKTFESRQGQGFSFFQNVQIGSRALTAPI
jgi:hypothetical protein